MPSRCLAALFICLTVSGTATAAAPMSVADAVKSIEQGAIESRSDAVLLMRGDEVLLERYEEAGRAPLELMSVTKSVVALGIGALLDEGLLESLDTPVSHFYPEWKQGRKADITVRMLMDHSSGLQNLPITTEEIYPAPDAVQLALAAELSHEPGKHFSYNNKAVNLLAGIIQRASGEPMDAYIARRIFAPLGITPGTWAQDSVGNPRAMSGLALSARDAAALGRLVLDQGRHGNQQVLSAEFIDSMLDRSHLSSEVGLLWWRLAPQVHFHADADSIEFLERVGLRTDLLDKLRPLQGRRFASVDELHTGLAEAWGADWLATWQEVLIEPHRIGPWRPFHSVSGPVEVYMANGWLGQSIVIIPKVDLVAVRQIASRETHIPSDNYQDFVERVQELGDAIERAEGGK